MYLTCLRINTARTGAHKLLGSPQAMHAAVMAGFPGILPSDTEQPRILWRLDHNSRTEVFLYVASPDRPDFTHVIEQAGWPASDHGWQTRDFAPLLARLEKGDNWSFRLTANPVRRYRPDPNQRAKPVGHVSPKYQMEWLLERQERAGFRVLPKPPVERILPHDEHQLVVSSRRLLKFHRGGAKAPVQLQTATFDGRLEVTDVGALRTSLTQGIGRAKAYGCGLMTLAPVPRVREDR